MKQNNNTPLNTSEAPQAPEVNIHHRLGRFSRGTLLLAAVVFLGVIILGVWILVANQKESTKAVEAKDVSQAQGEMVKSLEDQEAEYREAVMGVLLGMNLENTSDVSARLQTVLALRVPQSYKDAHLQMVIALGDAKNGEHAEAKQRLEEIQKANSWLRW